MSSEANASGADRFFDALPYALALALVALVSSFVTTAYERATWGDPAMMRASLDRYHSMLLRPLPAAPAGSGGLESGAAPGLNAVTTAAPPGTEGPEDRLRLRIREAGGDIGSALVYLDSPPDESPWMVIKSAASLLRDGVSTAVAVLTVASWLYSRSRKARRTRRAT